MTADLHLADRVRQLYPRATDLRIGGAIFRRSIMQRWSEWRERETLPLTAASVNALRDRGAVVIEVYGTSQGRAFGACYSPASLLREVAPCAF